MSDFVQQRHKPPVSLQRPRELLLACPPMRSNVNLSRIVRAAACCGIPRMICCGNARILPEISRETGDSIQIEIHRTLPPVIKRLKAGGLSDRWAGAGEQFQVDLRVPVPAQGRAGDWQ